jgi:hypothetical protein
MKSVAQCLVFMLQIETSLTCYTRVLPPEQHHQQNILSTAALSDGRESLVIYKLIYMHTHHTHTTLITPNTHIPHTTHILLHTHTYHIYTHTTPHTTHIYTSHIPYTHIPHHTHTYLAHTYHITHTHTTYTTHTTYHTIYHTHTPHTTYHIHTYHTIHTHTHTHTFTPILASIQEGEVDGCCRLKASLGYILVLS